MKPQSVLTFFLSILMAGCGTVNTVVGGDATASRGLKKAETYCDSIPRVYSGVSYNFCLLHAEPYAINTQHGIDGVPLLAMDFVLSGMLDTVALPYTIYRQCTDGNIEIQ